MCNVTSYASSHQMMNGYLCGQHEQQLTAATGPPACAMATAGAIDMPSGVDVVDMHRHCLCQHIAINEYTVQQHLPNTP